MLEQRRAAAGSAAHILDLLCPAPGKYLLTLSSFVLPPITFLLSPSYLRPLKMLLLAARGGGGNALAVEHPPLLRSEGEEEKEEGKKKKKKRRGESQSRSAWRGGE